MNQYKISKSFYDWCIENNREDVLDRWDYELNDKSPKEVGYASNKKYWFKCPKGIHESELYKINPLTNDNISLNDFKCSKCNSIGNFLINKYGDNILYKIWSEKNIYDPFKLSAHSLKKIWLKCLNDSTHPDYEVSCDNATKTIGCPYCSGRKVCLTNSLGYKYQEILNKWSSKNEKSPFEYTSMSNKKVWFKCENKKHNDYLRSIDDEIVHDMKCPICGRENQKHCGGSKKKEPEDLSGKIFGRLTAVDYIRKGKNNSVYWICNCKCGNVTEVEHFRLKHGVIQSCGCLWLESISGENNHNWNGGSTSELEKARHCEEYKIWQNEVYKKDWYTCQCCGKTKDLRAHHILNFSDHEDLRYDVTNGITLCNDCHDVKGEVKSFHNKYGTKK